jgi:hypothetical protein
VLWSWKVGDGYDGIEVIGNESFIGDDDAKGEILKNGYLSDASRLYGLSR